MGGLIARWFLDVLGGADLTRRLITLGTPYAGSMNAALALSNGVARKLGPLEISLSKIVRSLPSAYQLLPTYACVETPGGGLRKVTAETIPNLSATSLADAQAFHATSLEAARKGAGGYAVSAIKGIMQPTVQSLRRDGAAIVGLRDEDGALGRGDGTVPRDSAHPQDWPSDGQAVFVSQQHGSLQVDEDVHRQVLGLITERTTRTMGGALAEVGLLAPDSVLAAEPIPVEVTSATGDERLGLVCEARPQEGGATVRTLMQNRGGGAYGATLPRLAPGIWRLRIKSATSGVLVRPVDGLIMVWDDTAT